MEPSFTLFAHVFNVFYFGLFMKDFALLLCLWYIFSIRTDRFQSMHMVLKIFASQLWCHFFFILCSPWGHIGIRGQSLKIMLVLNIIELSV
jgi:hypothetical protein